MGYGDTCSECGRVMDDGEKYYRFASHYICTECIEMTEGEKCALCAENADRGISYKGINICCECAEGFAGYNGYI